MRAAYCLLAIFLLGVLSLVSCSSAPSLDDAATELQKDTHALETDDVFKNPLKKLHIIARPDTDISCGDGHFKRVLEATADYTRANEPVDNYLDRAQRLMEDTLRLPRFGYDVTFDPAQVDQLTGRTIHGTKEALGITVTVEVHEEPPTWRLRAESRCLAR
ncbi:MULTISPECIES: hypothetical protein [unclassified Nonomuraea]|uniref:hypothetical protein n=1 Tax=unclassified Nonomuraea TaxID=2593643 RepID=UPI0033F23C02